MTFDGTAIDELLENAVAAGALSGASAIAVDRDGVLHHASAGSAHADTMFRNASMTKAPATVGALQLVEQGRLDLDATVESILPEFGQLQVLDGFDGDTPLLRAPKTKATVRQLATHTSGCGYFFTNAELSRYAQLTGLPSVISGLKASLMSPLARDPGTQWEYGISTDWLGLVVEAVAGQTLDAYLAQSLYAPLGMSDTSFAPSDEQRARLMELQLRMPDGSLGPLELDVPDDPEWASAGHGSYGTITDYGRFMRAMLRDGELDGVRVLDAATVRMAFTDQLGGLPLPQIMKSADPILTNDVPTMPVHQGWGLGFHLIGIDVPNMRSAGTGDWAGLFNCFYWIDRKARIGGALMTQVLPFFDLAVIETLLDFEVAVYAQVGEGAPA
ncbi:MAG TPA: serine hydrolase domain-containing protein [Solirubrobacteraceae bacterium]